MCPPAHLAHLDREVGLRSRAAEQRQTGAILVVGQRRLLVRYRGRSPPGGTRPCSSHAPLRQPYGRVRSAPITASRSVVSSVAHANAWSLGFIMICGMGATGCRARVARIDSTARVAHVEVLRVLLIGCGDVAMRAAGYLNGRARLCGLVRRIEEVPRLRAHGVAPIVGDLDDFRTLRRLPAAPFGVLHFAPPRVKDATTRARRSCLPR